MLFYDCFDFGNFNPRPSREGRHGNARAICMQKHFNPRPSREGRLQNKQSQRENISESLVNIHIKMQINRRAAKLLPANGFDFMRESPADLMCACDSRQNAIRSSGLYVCFAP